MPLNRLLFTALLILFFIAPLPLGSNRDWAMLALSGLCLLLMAIYLTGYLLQDRQRPNKTGKLRIDPAAYLILAAAAWMLIQGSLKIPLDLLHTLSPATATLYASAFEIPKFGDSPTTATLSLNAAQSVNRGLFTLACFCSITLLRQLITTRKRLTIFCYTLVISGVFQAIYGVMMTLTGVEYLFLTPKTSYIGNATGTFVNRNHLAGYLEMTLSVGVGLLLSSRKQSSTNQLNWRSAIRLITQTLLSQIAILRGLLIIMVVGLLMTHSRMGNAGFFNALLITGGIALATSKQFRRPGFYAILISIVLIDIALLGSLFDLEKVVDRLEGTGLNHEKRDEVVKYALTMLPDYWLFGSGAGTFAYVFPQYAKEYLGGFYDFAHNDYLQILLELGLIGSLPLVSYVVIAIWRSWNMIRSERSTTAAGIGFACIMAAICLIIHSSVDFNLQIPANIMTFVAILALPSVMANINEHSKRNRPS